jgi:putative aldouronate transport system substrate-binding protein
MKKAKSTILLALILVTVLLMSSCVTGGVTVDTDSTTNTAATETKTPTPTTTKKEEPVKFSIFYQEAGQTFPDGFKHEDNWFINYICEKANVELTEVIVPAYADTQTKFNLMMSSGEIPDLVERADPATMKQYGAEGAFLPVLDIIKNSPVLSSFYTDVQLQAMQSSDGKNYVIITPPMVDDYSGIFVRWDLLQKLGYTKLPESLDEWVEALRKLKQLDPTSIPLVARQNLSRAQFVFRPYNVGSTGSGWQYYPERDKVCNVWEGDNIVRAVEFGKMLYDEGLWDQEFATTNSGDYTQKILRNNVLYHCTNFGSLSGWIQRFINDDQTDVRLVATKMPIAENVGIDQWYNVPFPNGSYAFGINKNSKAVDGIVRFLEVLYGDEVKDIATYGREGIEYKVVNNEKVPIFPAAIDNSYLGLYGWVSANNSESLNFGNKLNIDAGTKLSDTEKVDYYKLVSDEDKKNRELHLHNHLRTH